MTDKYLNLVEGLEEISRYVENTMIMHDLKIKKEKERKQLMSNLTNERIKESILDEIGSMSVNDFLDQLKARPLMDVHYKTACMTIEKLYDTMWEEYPDE